jgi:TPR repeat protein
MKLIPLFLLLGMLAVSVWADLPMPEPYSPELEKNAEKGNAEAQYELGQCHEKGLGCIRDNKEAVKWYTKSAEQGHVMAAFNLSRCWEDGQGVPRYKKQAMKWFAKVLESTDIKELYRILRSIDPYCNYNSDKSVLLLKRLAELGNAKAQYDLGNVCRWDGVVRGGVDDRKESVKWYTMAAEQGNADAQFWLGICYRQGEGVDRDEKEGFKWLTKSAEQGNADAQFCLGNCYEYGSGVDKDEKEAVNWYTKAADQGNASAKRELKRFKTK